MSKIYSEKKNRITSFEVFSNMAEKSDLIPVILEIDCGKHTPLSIYRKLDRGGKYSFLLESSVYGSTSGKYSFIGTDPEKVFRVDEKGCEVMDRKTEKSTFHPGPSGLEHALKDYLHYGRPVPEGDLPPFTGGVAGYFGYEMIDDWEDLFSGQNRRIKRSDHYSTVLMGFLTVVAFDHEKESLYLIHNVRIPSADNTAKEQAYGEGVARLKELRDSLERGLFFSFPDRDHYLGEVEAGTKEEAFYKMVRQGRERIVAGDICQVVLSQQFYVKTDLPSLDIYETLKKDNPSPYLFYLDLPELELIGSSPEVLVKLEGSRITTRPLAGTRQRGSTKKEDAKLAAELLSDEKERAEHIMLVDLARNDLGRVCKTKSVRVTELMDLEYYSRVIHIVSQVEGEKKEDLNSLDVLKAAFPAGTVSGAPKIRAMEIIDDLERSPREAYAGAAGYIDFGGDLDTCIVIRTMFRKKDRITLQAGAGIVYDSVPEKEYEETRNKASALFRALEKTYERSCKK
jgi:anthranilate synthase component 1